MSSPIGRGLVGDKPVVPGGDLLRITTHTCLRHNHRALRRRRIAAGLAVPCHVTLLGGWIVEYEASRVSCTPRYV
jgi:hypothetical protein